MTRKIRGGMPNKEVRNLTYQKLKQEKLKVKNSKSKFYWQN